MAKMRAAQVAGPNRPIEMVEREIPEPGDGEVRIRVEACGVCHSDSFTKEGTFPGIQYPRIPGHEVAGIIDVIGTGVTGWTLGQRAGVGWQEDTVAMRFLPAWRFRHLSGRSPSDRHRPRRRLRRIHERTRGRVGANSRRALCGGCRTADVRKCHHLQSSSNSGARSGDLVAVLGIGGLGHLGIQFAAKMGFKTVAIARGRDKEALAQNFGAQQYINSESQNAAAELAKDGRR